MAEDYNADLITQLFLTDDVEKAKEISDEMVGIGNLIFPRIIYEAYKKFKNTSSSHYFISDLAGFRSPEVAEIMKEIAHEATKSADFEFTLDYLADIEYFDPTIIEKASTLLKDKLFLKGTDEYDVEACLAYLKKSKNGIKDLEPVLQACFENEGLAYSLRTKVLRDLLVSNKQLINYYYENYDKIKNKKAEIIFAEEISTWQGGIIPELHKKILKNGSRRAQEIIEEAQTKRTKTKDQAEKKEQEKIKGTYETADIVSGIAALRTKVNRISSADKRFGFPFFAQSEEFYEQNKPAQNKASLVGYCMVLREFLQKFDEAIKDSVIPVDKAKQFLPEIQDWGGSINKFHYLLLDKGVTVDKGIFGLRNINRLVTKLAHPNETLGEEFINLLTEEKLLDMYTKDNWSLLHREILLRYEKVLEKLIAALSEGSTG